MYIHMRFKETYSHASACIEHVCVHTNTKRSSSSGSRNIVTSVASVHHHSLLFFLFFFSLFSGFFPLPFVSHPAHLPPHDALLLSCHDPRTLKRSIGAWMYRSIQKRRCRHSTLKGAANKGGRTRFCEPLLAPSRC